MPDEPVVNVQEVRAVVNRLLDVIEKTEGVSLTADVDHYWNLPLSAVFELYADPGSLMLDVGQLSDDVQSVREMLTHDPEEPVHVWHDLSHVIGVLRFLAWRDLPG
jgi:hypothetical protein